jgi:hypothetical protein
MSVILPVCFLRAGEETRAVTSTFREPQTPLAAAPHAVQGGDDPGKTLFSIPASGIASVWSLVWLVRGSRTSRKPHLARHLWIPSPGNPWISRTAIPIGFLPVLNTRDCRAMPGHRHGTTLPEGWGMGVVLPAGRGRPGEIHPTGAGTSTQTGGLLESDNAASMHEVYPGTLLPGWGEPVPQGKRPGEHDLLVNSSFPCRVHAATDPPLGATSSAHLHNRSRKSFSPAN